MKKISWENEYDGYLSYLESETWRKLRNETLKKDNFRCALCNSPYQLEVHHLFYPSILGTETANDLITVCSGCHKLLESLKRGSSIRVAKQGVYVTFYVHIDNKQEFKIIESKYKENENTSGFITYALLTENGKNLTKRLGFYSFNEICNMKKTYEMSYKIE